MKKSVLIDCERMKYPKSGLANVCRSLIYGIKNNVSNFNITFYIPRKYVGDTRSNVLFWRFWQKKIPVSTQQFDLIHVTHQLSDYFHNIENHQKKVVTLHDLNFLYENLSEKKKMKKIKLVQKNIGNADAIICISNFAKNDFILHKKAFKLKKNVIIESVYNGLIFPENKIYISEKLEGLKAIKYILNIGVLFPKKNQLVLLDFLMKTELHLVLISSSEKKEYKEKFLQKIKELNLEKRVHIFSNLDENEKNFLLQNCESYVHTSLAEGFGIPLVEAMYFGKPIFVSDKTSLPEIGGDVAFYFNDFAADKMFQVYESGMNDYKLNKEQFILRLKSRACIFDAKEMSKKYLNIYSKLLD